VAISRENIAFHLKRPANDPLVATLAELYHRKPDRQPLVSFQAAKAGLLQLADLTGADKAAVQAAMTRIDHPWPRPLAARGWRAILYRLNPDLIDRRQEVRV